MDHFNFLTVNPEKFRMRLLPLYAAFLLERHLDAYVRKMLEFSKNENLPLLKKLDKFSDEELIGLGKISHADTLTALSNNTIHTWIEQNVRNWVSNNLEVIDKDEVVAEDLTQTAFIKRNCMQYFIPLFTPDLNEQAILREEIDRYTTQEELVSYDTYLKLQQDKLNKTNEALKFQESLLLEAQEISELGSFFTDYENPENSMSTPQMEKITGLDQPDDIAFFNRVHPDDRAQVKEAYEKAFESGGSFEYSFRYMMDGAEKHIQARGIVTRENGKLRFLKGTLRDITKNSLLIQRLTESEALHKEAEKLTHLGNWAWDVGDNTIQWSDEMYRIYGLEPQSETITFDRFVGLIHPDSRETRLNEINESLQTGIVKDYNLKIVTPAGNVKILRGLGSISTDADGQPKKVVGTCQDITAEFHLKNELMALNEELSIKNEELLRTNNELESFNYIASHDLQEPLRKIQIYTEKVIHQADGLSNEMRMALEKVISSTTRMRTLIKDLMVFSQISLAATLFEKTPLNAIFDKVLEEFAESIEQGNAIFHIDTLPEVTIIPFQFQQLLTNIVGNSIKYRKQEEPAIISVSSTVVRANDIGVASAKGKYLKVSISDNGIGFEAEHRENIFDLFKRLHTNETYSGTGIGLAICKKIMQNHNGYITADSIAGEGSVFNIYLPY